MRKHRITRTIAVPAYRNGIPLISPKDSPKDAPKDAPKETAAKSAKAAAANAATKTNAELACAMEELRQALQAQQEQLQMLKEELAKRDRQIDDEAREAAASATLARLKQIQRQWKAVTTSTGSESTGDGAQRHRVRPQSQHEVLKDTVAGGGQAAANKATERRARFHPLQGNHHHPGRFSLAAERKPFSARARHNRT